MKKKSNDIKEDFNYNSVVNTSIYTLIYNYFLIMIFLIIFFGNILGIIYSLKCKKYLLFILNFILGLFCIPSGAIYFYFYYDPTTCLIPTN